LAETGALSPGVEFVRPGNAALEWLHTAITSLKGDDPLRHITLIVPNYYAGRVAAHHLAQVGGFVNVRFRRLSEFATIVAAPAMVGSEALTEARQTSAIHASLTATDGPLTPLAEHPSLQGALAHLFRELRRQELDAQEVLGSESRKTAKAALTAYRTYRGLTGGYLDQTGIRRLAAERLAHGFAQAFADLGALVVFLPTRLDPVDVHLIAAAGRLLPMRVALPYFGDPSDGDRESLSAGQALCAAIGVDAALGETARGHPLSATNTSVVSAPSPTEEVYEALRRIAEDLEHEVALYRIAILYRQVEPYAAIVRESLDLAGIPWSALEGRPIGESLPAQALIALLALRAQNYARSAVVGWLDVIAGRAGDEATQNPALWDRISREAGITAGLEQWTKRLVAHAAALDEQAEEGERIGWSAATRERLREDASTARDMAAYMQRLDQTLRPPSDRSPWNAFVDWTLQLWQEECGGEMGWPVDEVQFARQITSLLERLRDAGYFEEPDAGPSFTLFATTVQNALMGQARPVRRLGEGVLIGPVQSVMGQTFERVHILGLTEGSFPPRPPISPFFPPGEPDPLHLAERQRSDERRNFLTAVAAADHGQVTLYTPASLGGRIAFPSSYLLEVVGLHLGGGRVDTATFRGLRQADHPWLTVLPSAEEAAARAQTAADREDLRMGRVIRWTRRGLPLAQHPLAIEPGLPIGVGLAMSAARRSAAFTPFDGNLAPLAGTLQGLAPASTSAVERWAACPFRYFLSDHLRVRPTPRPQDTWTIEPLERGTLVHRILHAFFATLRANGGVAAEFTSEQRSLLGRIASQHFEQTADRGLAGHPLIWENAAGSLLSDLQTFLAADAFRREGDGMAPLFLEATFGTGSGAWPPVELEIAGERLRFRGVIDRLDADETLRRIHVFDYKAGKADGYKGLTQDPVLAGRHVQLAVYMLAVRRALNLTDSQVGASYSFVTRNGGFTLLPLPDNGEEVEERLLAVLETILAGMHAGAFPQVPGSGSDQLGNCRYCEYDRICPAARDDAWERKSAADGYRHHAQLAVVEAEE
jgi:hypothetical protein